MLILKNKIWIGNELLRIIACMHNYIIQVL